MRAKRFHELTPADVMSDVGFAIPEGMSVRGAARLMAEAGACAAPVTDAGGRYIGLLLASDVLRWVADGEPTGPDTACFWSEWQMDAAVGAATVGRRRTVDPPVVTPDAPLPEVARQLLARRTAAVVVDRRHRPVGVLSPADVLAAVMACPIRTNDRDSAVRRRRAAVTVLEGGTPG